MIESNAIRYTAGYIVAKKTSIKKQKMIYVQCITAVREMAGKLKIQNCASDQKDQSSKWIKVGGSRGPVSRTRLCVRLFVTIEYSVDDKLSEILKEKGKGIEWIQKDQLTWVIYQDEVHVQLLWNQVDAFSIVEDETG